MQDLVMARSSQNGSAQKDLRTQGGGLSIAAYPTGPLEFSQQVEEHQNAQKGRLGGKELPPDVGTNSILLHTASPQKEPESIVQLIFGHYINNFF